MVSVKKLYRVFVLTVTIVIFSFSSALAQEPAEPPQLPTREEQLERAAEQGGDNIDLDELQRLYALYRKDPLNLNSGNYSRLHESGLMNELQVTNLLTHIEKNGPLIAFEELQSIDGFDELTLQTIAPFVTTGSNSNRLNLTPAQILQEAGHQLIVRTGMVLEQQSGYTITDTSVNRYLGSPYSLYVRYRYTLSQKFSLGITAEKDAGEEFFTGSQKQGFDYYSAHLFVRDIGFIKKIALGDYQLEYGQGINVWSGLAFGKSPDITTVKRNARGIVPYASVNEESFRRGAALSLGFGKLTTDLWYSYRKTDGNLLPQDSLQAEFFVSSLQTSGLHRTPSELENKNTLGVRSAGTHVAYADKRFETGITIASIHFDKPLQRPDNLYSLFQFEGTDYLNVSFDYRISWSNLVFFGEAAHSQNNAYAFNNGVIASLDPKFSVSLVQRNYQKDFQAIESNALRENNNFNEKGYIFSALYKPLRSLSFSGYYDMFSYPWLRFTTDAPSQGYEYLWQLTYTPDKKTEIYLRHKQTLKQENSFLSTDIDYPVDVKSNSYRLSFLYKVTPSFTLRSRIDVVRITREDAEDNHGFAMIQDFFFKPQLSRFSVNFRLVLFDTDNYDSRVYAYENDVYGLFSIPSYYYEGLRYYLNVHYSPARQVDVYARISQTTYTNRSTVGSGLDEINNNSKTDLRFALKYEF